MNINKIIKHDEISVLEGEKVEEIRSCKTETKSFKS